MHFQMEKTHGFQGKKKRKHRMKEKNFVITAKNISLKIVQFRFISYFCSQEIIPSPKVGVS